MSNLTDLTVAGIRDGVKDGAFSAREVASAFIDASARVPLSSATSFTWLPPPRNTAPASSIRAAIAASGIGPSGVPRSARTTWFTSAEATSVE